MDRFFSFLSRNKSVFSFKNRSKTGKTDDFSSPAVDVKQQQNKNKTIPCKAIKISFYQTWSFVEHITLVSRMATLTVGYIVKTMLMTSYTSYMQSMSGLKGVGGIVFASIFVHLLIIPPFVKDLH